MSTEYDDAVVKLANLYHELDKGSDDAYDALNEMRMDNVAGVYLGYQINIPTENGELVVRGDLDSGYNPVNASIALWVNDVMQEIDPSEQTRELVLRYARDYEFSHEDFFGS